MTVDVSGVGYSYTHHDVSYSDQRTQELYSQGMLRVNQGRLASLVGPAEVGRSTLLKILGGVIEVRRIDAAVDIADTLARSRNVTYLPSGNQMLLGLGNM